MEHLWTKDYTAKNHDEYHCLNMVAPSPFSMLADSLAQELIQLMRDKRSLTAAIYLLLVPQLTKLDLSHCAYKVSDSIAQVISIHCRSLALVDLCGCFQISADPLVAWVKALPGLSKLNLSKTQCNTQVLSTVGSYCWQFRDLEIVGCKRLSAESLLHLAYDPISHSCCCQMLEILEVCPWGPGKNRRDLLWAMVFVLLALPNLKWFSHNLLTEALCMIHDQQFDAVEMPPGFPPLMDLAWFRMITFPSDQRNRLTLAFQEVHNVDEYSWPIANAVCPYIVEMSVILTGRTGLDQSFWSCHHLVHLTISCMDNMDMREFLPVVASVGAQLQSLSVYGFFFTDEFSFHALLGQCLNLQKLNIHFCSPLICGYGGRTNVEALFWNFGLPPLEFLQVCDFTLTYADRNTPLPTQHKVWLRECLESLLRYSPCLQDVELVSLPFNLDEVFVNVLEPSGTAVLHLRGLTLTEDYVTVGTIHRLLSSDNEPSNLALINTGIHGAEFEELLWRFSREGLEVDIEWG